VLGRVLINSPFRLYPLMRTSPGDQGMSVLAQKSLMRCSKQAYSITWSARSNMEVGIVRMSKARLRGTTRCSWDNSPRPGAGKKLSLLPAKVVEVGPCQTLDKLDVPRFSTPPGRQHTASVSPLPHLVATAAPAA